jgi:H+-translocating NAD(P) transhydrogenase subunit alpha
VAKRWGESEVAKRWGESEVAKRWGESEVAKRWGSPKWRSAEAKSEVAKRPMRFHRGTTGPEGSRNASRACGVPPFEKGGQGGFALRVSSSAQATRRPAGMSRRGGYDAGRPLGKRTVSVDGFVALYIFMLAAIAGHVIISRVPVILHTPLMSGSNFIHGIVLIGAMVVLGHADTTLEKAIGFIAVLLGAGNAAGGYVVTERMLDMFKSSKKPGTDGKGDKA